ncbi:DUF1972 domain-containing protein [Octadecabacter ascidiaceicola]|uniref:Glycosyl transferases group 1 n=1 Tax=Octadecabacter ascidiaceicola TaxID=1655543 RepID=A0A238KT69_9RHOB|nr:DUF1972 domain-containing protein [Octadecabacter ascidiaceicola]SMX45322.1 Glycosyl transferases group 1 [Octadecabacter ascidiaceicola]
MIKTKASLAIVGTVGLPANYGGWETLVENIVTPLSEQLDVTVYCSRNRYKTHLTSYKGAQLDYIGLNANGIQSIFYDIVCLWRARSFDHVLILGTSGCIALPLFRLISKAHYTLNIDGLEWRREKWSGAAKAFLRMSEYLGCRFAHQLVADNAVIQTHIQTAYNCKSALIAYGGDSPAMEIIPDPEIPQEPYAFSVCRIEPENNLHMILEAYAGLPESRLVIIGNWKSSAFGLDLKKRYGALKNITLLDPIYDRGKLDGYRAGCQLYLHGHSAGGTNPSLVEAMWLGLPILAFDVNFNRETTEDQALYFTSIQDLREKVEELQGTNLSELANTMKGIADRRYTWANVARDYLALLG